jgi:hypothetical protein
LRLSNKISFSEAVPKENQLSSIWGGVFFHPIFVDGGARYLGLDGNPKSIEYDGKILGMSNILYRKRAGITTATIPLLFQYFGPVFYDPALEEIFFRNVIDHYIETCDFIYLSFTPEFNSIEKLKDGWRIFKSTTLAITDSDLDNWGVNFRDDVKNKINKANRERVRIERSASLPERLWELSYTRKGSKTPVKPSDLKAWCSGLIDGSILHIYSAIIEDREVAFRGQLIYGNFAYDWIAGSDPRYHNLGTNQLLMAEIGSELRKRDISLWDLVDGRMRGIADFKKSFGAKEFLHWQACKSVNIRGKLFGALRRMKNA